MLIMPSTDVNFQALADNITNDFFTKGVPLADSIVKVAKENSFNPEEVTRLVEKTNTAASLHLLKTAEDKKATFTLAQRDLVLQRTHPSTEEDNEVNEKTASLYQGIPNTKAKKIDTPLLIKTAQVAETSTVKNIDAMQSLFTVRKSLEDFKLKKMATESEVQDRIDYLASEFNVWNGPSFEKFANDCLNLFGNKSRPVLEGLAKYLNAPLAKTAEEVDFVDDRTDHIKAMKTICSGLENIIKLGSTISNLEKIQTAILTGLKTHVPKR